jgi:hypothetical protein
MKLDPARKGAAGHDSARLFCRAPRVSNNLRAPIYALEGGRAGRPWVHSGP